jgi:GNAT superfamily N-acetyltransferase
MYQSFPFSEQKSHVRSYPIQSLIYRASDYKMILLDEVSRHDRHKLLKQTYKDILATYYPDVAELDTFKTMFTAMECTVKKPDANPKVHNFVIIDLKTDNTLAHAQIELHKDACCSFISYVAVRKEDRRQGLGEKLVKTLENFAYARLGPQIPIFADLKKREAILKTGDMKTTERLSFWDKQGYTKIDFPYAYENRSDEPAYTESFLASKGKKPIQKEVLRKFMDGQRKRLIGESITDFVLKGGILQESVQTAWDIVQGSGVIPCV